MAWVVLVLLAWWSLVPAAVPQRSPATLRFHHLHYRAADPLTAMRQIAGPAAQPIILQGLGAGVRAGGLIVPFEYVLFDRPEAVPAAPQIPVETQLPRLIGWLSSVGFPVSADVEHVRALSDQLTGDTFDHVGFATANFPEALERLRRSGARVSNTTDASAFVDGGRSGLRVEIVRDPDLPDAFWCPMHPDVRSASAGSCPICRMALVPIPAPRLGEYRMDVSVVPARRGKGAAGLRLTVGDPDQPGRVPVLLTVHDKRLHLFVIGADLNYFAHVHPEPRANGSFEIAQELPAGEYMVVADFLPAGGTPQMVQRAIVTPGYDAGAHAVAPRAPQGSNPVSVEGVSAAFVKPALIAGQMATLRLKLTDEQSHSLITDLEPYLSAPAHAVFASADLTHVTHVHPQEQDAFGPYLSFDLLPARPGPYKIWVQIQRHGRVLTFPLEMEVGK